MLMVAGENHPRASKTLATSDSRSRLVTIFSCLHSDVESRNESDLVSH